MRFEVTFNFSKEEAVLSLQLDTKIDDFLLCLLTFVSSSQFRALLITDLLIKLHLFTVLFLMVFA